jgi:hypothetical protein
MLSSSIVSLLVEVSSNGKINVMVVISSDGSDSSDSSNGSDK